MIPSMLRSLLCLLLGSVISASAEVRLADIFSDHAVLQRNQPVPVWGWADPGEKITVTFNGQTHSTTATDAGTWRVDLDPMQANAKGGTLEVSGSSVVTRNDILVGEVWLCGGQSNMEWTVMNSRDAVTEIGLADYSLIRHVKVAKNIESDPTKTFSGEWTVCSPETVPHYTAVGYYFARRLHQQLLVPIGLVNSTWGGTPVEAWLPPESLHDPDMAVAVATHQQLVNDNILNQNLNYRTQFNEWEAARQVAVEAGLDFDPKAPNRPWQPGPFKTATVLYNGMIEPLLPYALAGAIWYQGEGNGGQPETYRAMFTELIEQWRAKFEQPDLPFYWAQLASWDSGAGDSTDWAFLREAQHKTLALPNTGQAILMDIGEAFDIHPRNKQDVGDRLARIALAQDYDRDVAYRGPNHDAITLRGDEVTVHLHHADGLTTRDGEAPRGFEVAGVDGEFQPATATIKGDQVVLTSEAVSHPVLVRYAWRRWVDANLQNGEGLPAEPFRTDSL